MSAPRVRRVLETALYVDNLEGGTSLYFRDPDGHSVEIATPGVWETY